MKHSHSSVNKFTECAMAYDLHYNKKYRPKYHSSALLFGSAIDKAVEEYLKTKNKEVARRVFKEMWEEQDINKVKTQLATCTNIVYANNDFDIELLSLQDIQMLMKDFNIENVSQELDAIYKQKDVIGFNKLKKEKKQLLNAANWLCLRRKGLLMLKEAIRVIDENIEEVLGTQVKVNLSNDNGDEVIGYADAVVRLKGQPKPVVIDFKTATRPYEDDSVLTSHQLALYIHDLSDKYEDTRSAGYIVLSKIIRKNKKKICTKCGFDGSGSNHKTCNNVINDERCHGTYDIELDPQASSQVILGEIPFRLEDIVIENMDNVNQAITYGIKIRNLQACKKPWGLCPYFKYCHQDSMEDIVDMNKVEEASDG